MKRRSKRSAAFSLVEVTLALGICSFCLIALIGLLPSGLSATADANRETTALSVASAILADLQSTGLVEDPDDPEAPYVMPPNSALYGVPCAAETQGMGFLSAGSDEWEIDNTAGQYWVTVQTAKGDSGAYTFNVKVSWPGAAKGNTGTRGAVSVFGRSLAR